MSDPSITSGESIILTTHGVSFNGVLYSKILTTRRPIVVDSGDPRCHNGRQSNGNIRRTGSVAWQR